MTIVTWLPAFCESLFFDEEELGVDKRGEERGRREERREGRGEERRAWVERKVNVTYQYISKSSFTLLINIKH